MAQAEVVACLMALAQDILDCLQQAEAQDAAQPAPVQRQDALRCAVIGQVLIARAGAVAHCRLPFILKSDVITLRCAPMRIFLSYASEDRSHIEPIRYALGEQGHDVFYDREDLKPGEAFDSRIRAAIERCDLFICFLTPHTTDAGSYTLNELAVAERRWPLADGRVLPVILADVPRKDIPAYL